ncbi:MAG TPA: methylmalonyl-CoA mutase family protein, partial [Terriglobales bacterium]|nr:methylmalonyl-CoA mutase family protein [Terriglobales bacterium]
MSSHTKVPAGQTAEKPVADAPKPEPQETSSHIPVNPLYTPADLSGWDYDQQVGYPGDLPYTRG